MENIPSAEEILRNNIEKESEEICKEVEADFEKVSFLAEECKNRMFDNEIYIIDDESINETNWIGEELSQRKFGECMDKKDGGIEEDLFNLQVGINRKHNYKDIECGFTVYYPEFRNGGVLKNKVKIVTKVSEFIEDIFYTKIV